MTNYPMPRTNSLLQINNTISGFFATFIFSMALAFKFSSIISFIVKERTDRSKHQQIVSGMSTTAYWMANMVYDYLLYFFITAIVILISKALSLEALTNGEAYGATWMLFIFYGLSYIPFTYIVSFYYQEYGNAMAAYYFITFIAGGMLPLLTFILRIISDTANPIGRGLAWIFRFYPAYAFGEGIINLGNTTIFGIRENNSIPMAPFDLEIALAPILYMAIGGPVFFGLLLLLEKLQNTESFMRCFAGETALVEETHVINEEDVKNESQLALAANPDDY